MFIYLGPNPEPFQYIEAPIGATGDRVCKSFHLVVEHSKLTCFSNQYIHSQLILINIGILSLK